MKVEIEINPEIEETTILIKARENSAEVQRLIQKLQNEMPSNKIIAIKNEKTYILDVQEIESIYSNQGKIYVRKEDNSEYISKSKLYEIEENLKDNHKNFIKISNSEIINFDKVESLDLSITGTIEIKTKSGYTTYVSRRNIKKIKEYLKM